MLGNLIAMSMQNWMDTRVLKIMEHSDGISKLLSGNCETLLAISYKSKLPGMLRNLNSTQTVPLPLKDLFIC